MTSRRAIGLVVRRELRERIRQRSLAVSSGITLAIVLAIAILPAVFDDDGPTRYDVGVVEPGGAGAGASDAAGFAEQLERVDLGAGVSVRTRTVDDRSEAERLVLDGTLDAVVDGEEVIVGEELGDELGAVVQLANRALLTDAALSAAGVDEEQAAAITDPPPLRTEALDPPGGEADERSNLVNIGVFFAFGQLFGYGIAVGSSIVEEKSSMVVELLLAKLRPAELLAGKILGVGVLGFAQLVLFYAVGLAAASASGTVDLPPGTVGATVLVLAWFTVGFALYSCLFAMAGAVASRVEELQNTSTPVSMVLMASYFVAISATGDPASGLARVASLLPPTAPMLMPIRIAAGEAVVWEVVASLALVLVTIVGVVRLAGRIYAGGALRTRGKISLRRAYAGGD